MIRAVAVAIETSDLIGTVDLACTARGLLLHFVRTSPFALSYAPTPPAVHQHAVVPYEAISGVWDDGETLRIAIDTPCIPYKRIIFAHFMRDSRIDHRQIHQKRTQAQTAAAAGIALVGSCLVPLIRNLPPLLALLLLGICIFGAVLGARPLSNAIIRRIFISDAQSDSERRIFFEELRHYLPKSKIEDNSLILEPASATSEATEPIWKLDHRIQDILPTLLAVGVSALLGLLVIATASSIRDISSETDILQASSDSALNVPVSPSLPIAPSAGALSHVPPASIEPEQERCECQTPSSPVLPTRVPRVSVFPSVQRLRLHPKKPYLALEIAAVNNSISPVHDLHGAITFLRPGKRADDPVRVGVTEGILYEGDLNPGAAIRWHVHGRGTSFQISTSEEGHSLDTSEVAPADVFAKLLSARTRSVRLHAASMLTRMRDMRAAKAIEKLREDGLEEEGAFLASLTRAAAPVYVCHLSLSAAETKGAARVSACVMNTSDTNAGPVDVQLRLTPISSSDSSSSAVPTAPTALSPQEPEAVSPPQTIAHNIILPAHAGTLLRGNVDMNDGLTSESVTSELLLEQTE